MEEDDDEYFKCVKNLTTDEIVPINELSQLLYNKFMKQKFGYTLWDRFDKEMDAQYFKKA